MLEKKTHERLVLLDAHAILHRAYHALPDFATSKGEPTGALFGLVSMVLKIATDLKPDYLVACYDLPKPTYRHEVYESYKAGRAKTDDELTAQMERSKEVCAALNIPIYSKEGFEADDMLGTIVEQMKPIRQQGGAGQVDIIIASGDMDTMQLVDDDKVKVYTLKKGINDTIMYDEKGVRERFGFGPELLPDYKGLRGDPSDNIIGIEGIGEKTASELIQKFGSIEKIYKALAKDPEKLKEAGIKERTIKLLQEGKEEAEFSKMLATIRRDAPIEFKLPKEKWKDGINMEKTKNIFNELEFRTMGARLANVLGRGEEETQKSREQERGIDPQELEEVKVALWVVDSNLTDPGLEEILQFAKTDSFEKAKKIIFDELKKRESEFVFEGIEKPIIPIVKKMQEHGVLIDKENMQRLKGSYTEELKEIEKKVWELAGEEFNVASPKQLSTILFDKLGLSVKNHKKTGGGAKSTKESELEKMRESHPIVPLVFEYREIAKLIGTYIEPIPKLIAPDGRLHARFIQTGTTTGRMSSENPNLQNIPVGSERGRAIREAFIVPAGSKLVAFDYSQIELRIAAILSGDRKLLDIFRRGEDVHTSVAASVFGVPNEEVTKEMRRKAKVINFGILYGMGVTALQGNLGTDRKTAQEFYNKYFEQYSGLARFLEKTKEEAARLGYTKTIFGRRRYFEGIKSKIPFIKAAAERMAVNAPIQGSQADIIKIAMKKIDDWAISEGLEGKMNLILQIHDELIYEIVDEVVDKARAEIIKIMEEALPEEKKLEVPITANSSVGKNWNSLKA